MSRPPDLAEAIWMFAPPWVLWHGPTSTRVIFGTDLPSTRTPRPFSDDDINLAVEAVGDDAVAAVLCDNALAVYHPFVDTPGL